MLRGLNMTIKNNPFFIKCTTVQNYNRASTLINVNNIQQIQVQESGAIITVIINQKVYEIETETDFDELVGMLIRAGCVAQ